MSDLLEQHYNITPGIHLKIFRTHSPVGYIELSSLVHLQVSVKPNIFRRLMMRLLFGWKYYSLNETRVKQTRQMLYG